MNQPQKQLKIILIGDTCIDEYQYGTVDRISPEAPIPVFVPKHTDIKSGMGSNVKENLEALGLSVRSFLGEPSKKKRLIDAKSKQQLIRIDDDVKSNPCNLEYVSAFLEYSDAVVISDYAKGFITEDFIKVIRQKYNGPIFVDTKKRDLKQFEGCIIKINETEYESRTSDCSNMVITHGGDSVSYNNKTFTVPKVDAFDVCGAGDTFLSALAYGYLVTKDMDQAIEFAIKASSITVQHIGVYAPTLEEINAS
jgi:D-beta-D-heptose 7-phosphate kinase/D-beta-D-heptose 1-phosphate adenosyltransferase